MHLILLTTRLFFCLFASVQCLFFISLFAHGVYSLIDVLFCNKVSKNNYWFTRSISNTWLLFITTISALIGYSIVIA